MIDSLIGGGEASGGGSADGGGRSAHVGIQPALASSPLTGGCTYAAYWTYSPPVYGAEDLGRRLLQQPVPWRPSQIASDSTNQPATHQEVEWTMAAKDLRQKQPSAMLRGDGPGLASAFVNTLPPTDLIHQGAPGAASSSSTAHSAEILMALACAQDCNDD